MQGPSQQYLILQELCLAAALLSLLAGHPQQGRNRVSRSSTSVSGNGSAAVLLLGCVMAGRN